MPGSYANASRTSPPVPQPRPPSLSVLLEVLDDLGLAHAGPLLRVVVDAGGSTDETQPNLAELLGVSERTIRRQELALERAGLLVIERRGWSNARTLTLASSPHSTLADCGQPGPTGHDRPDTTDRTRERRIHRIARARARSEEPSEIGSTRDSRRTRSHELAALHAYRNRSRAARDLRRASVGPEFEAIDAAIDALHARLKAWPNTLPEFRACARDLALGWGELAALEYLDNLETYTNAKAAAVRRPALVLGALRKRVAEILSGNAPAQGELFERRRDVGAERDGHGRR